MNYELSMNRYIIVHTTLSSLIIVITIFVRIFIYRPNSTWFTKSETNNVIFSGIFFLVLLNIILYLIMTKRNAVNLEYIVVIISTFFLVLLTFYFSFNAYTDQMGLDGDVNEAQRLASETLLIWFLITLVVSVFLFTIVYARNAKNEN
jgi:hypothetical protein